MNRLNKWWRVENRIDSFVQYTSGSEVCIEYSKLFERGQIRPLKHELVNKIKLSEFTQTKHSIDFGFEFINSNSWYKLIEFISFG